MKAKLNLFSFILSLICILLFFLTISSSSIINSMINLLHVHPLYIILLFCIVTLIIGLIGLSEATTRILLLRSILTLIITVILTVIIVYILVLANLFKFT